MSAELRMCKSCRRWFEIDEGERQWFGERDLTLPVRCPACRRWRAELQRQADAERLRDERER